MYGDFYTNRIDIAQAYNRYTDDVQKKVKRAVRRIGEEMRQEVIEKSPVRTGNYKSGWVKTVIKRDGRIKVIVHNNNYRIVHLQEFPHDMFRGHRYPGPDGGAVGVIREINVKYSDKLLDEVGRILGMR